jgi:hypothetical protein
LSAVDNGPVRNAAVVAATLLTVALAGCGADEEPIVFDRPGGQAVQPPAPAPPMSDSPVLYDDEFVVEEGVWYLGGRVPGLKAPFKDQSNGLVGAGSRGGLWVSGPALYGKYAVEIERFDQAPPVPGWCEDAVEVSYDHRSDGLVMGSFESQTDPTYLAPGTYRVRYCVSGHDAAAAETDEDEFDGDEYRLYSSRHLFQLWPAPMAADAVLREGSEFAKAENARIAGGEDY